ncbi:MAG: AroM family protein [Tissierellia bacterium]|nr:AroM family protein [Tissierellia bacterium]
MKSKLGVITIGQSPRVDVIPEMGKYLGDEVEIIELGALDGLSYEEILEFTPDEGDYVLISRLNDGRNVKFAKKYIMPRLQNCIKDLEKRKVDMILFICTGSFPEGFESNVDLIYPQKILDSVVPNLINGSKLGVITPLEDQINQTMRKWKDAGVNAKVVAANPYISNDELEKTLYELRDDDLSLIVLDCIGYDLEFKKKVIEITGKRVILSRSMVARIISEVLNEN